MCGAIARRTVSFSAARCLSEQAASRRTAESSHTSRRIATSSQLCPSQGGQEQLSGLICVRKAILCTAIRRHSCSRPRASRQTSEVPLLLPLPRSILRSGGGRSRSSRSRHSRRMCTSAAMALASSTPCLKPSRCEIISSSWRTCLGASEAPPCAPAAGAWPWSEVPGRAARTTPQCSRTAAPAAALLSGIVAFLRGVSRAHFSFASPALGSAPSPFLSRSARSKSGSDRSGTSRQANARADARKASWVVSIAALGGSLAACASCARCLLSMRISLPSRALIACRVVEPLGVTVKRALGKGDGGTCSSLLPSPLSAHSAPPETSSCDLFLRGSAARVVWVWMPGRGSSDTRALGLRLCAPGYA